MKNFKQFMQYEKACWKGYRQLGMKKKGDRMVPNCVPEEVELKIPNSVPEIKNVSEHLNCGTPDCCGKCETAMLEGSRSETWEAGYKRRVVKTTDPEHKEKGMNWRIKSKDRPNISIILYKEKPSQEEFNKQMKRVAGHEFGG